MIRRFRSFITELLDPDTVQPFAWTSKKPDRWIGKFSFEGRDYSLEALRKEVHASGDESWLYRFGAADNPGGTEYASTGDHNQFEVLSTVIAALKMFLITEKPFSVAVIGWKTGFSTTHGRHMKNRRGFLYPRLLDRYSSDVRSMGYVTHKKEFGRKTYSVLIRAEKEREYKDIAGDLDVEY